MILTAMSHRFHLTRIHPGILGKTSARRHYDHIYWHSVVVRSAEKYHFPNCTNEFFMESGCTITRKSEGKLDYPKSKRMLKYTTWGFQLLVE